MKIVHLIQRYPPALGGSEAWCAQLARHQGAAGHKVRVLTTSALDEEEYWRPKANGAPPPERLERGEGVEVRRYPVSRWVPFGLSRADLPGISSDRAGRLLDALPLAPHSLPLYWSLPQAVRWADLTHLHALPYPHNYAGLAVARLLGKPVAITPHFHPGRPGFESPWALALLRSCGAVFAVTGWEQEHLTRRGVPASRILVTGNAICRAPWEKPVDEEKRRRLFARLGLRAEADLVTYLGRKMPQKGVGLLLDAAPEIVGRGGSTFLVLAGPGSRWFGKALAALPAPLRAQVKDAGVVEEGEKIALLQKSRVLVNPSEEEAFGIVFLEAWAAGIPVVGCRAGAIPEVIGRGGLLFEAGRAAELAQRVREILDEPALAARLASAGQEQLDQWDWEKIAAVVEQGYGRMVGPERTARAPSP